MGKACHILIAKTAEQMAEELYEELAHNNVFFTHNPDRATWVNNTWPTLLDSARSLLASMLGEIGVSERDKELIYEALLLDKPLRGKKARYGRA